MPSPPSYQKVNPGDQPVIFLSLRSATLPLSTVNEYAETIAQRISMVSGVAQVQLFGAAKYAVRVDVDPRKLSARGIGIDEVATAIQSANVNLPTGTMYGPDRAFTVLANGQLMRAAGYAPVVIAYRNGNPVRLNEVARVYDGIEQDKSANFYRGPAQHQPVDSEAAGHQRRRGRRFDQDAAADVPRAVAAVGHPRRAHRSLRVDPRVGARRQADAVADVRAGRGGDLRLPAQRDAPRSFRA